MISIVVCSANEKMFDEFSQRVQLTIGTPFEIIRIDNKDNRYTICEAYNKGKGLCRYEIVCFCHEDILFETNNWGKVLADVLANAEIGLVGVLGICYYSLFPANWIPLSECEGQITVGALNDAPTQRYARFPGSAVAEVAAADGVFLSTRKEIIDTLQFSEDILKGFHGYDLDISFQVRLNYKVVITRDILFYHHSGGTYNQAYFDALNILYKKWHKHLPAYTSSYSKKEIRQLKIRSLEEYWQRKGNWNLLNGYNRVAIRYALRQGVLAGWITKRISSGVKKIITLLQFRSQSANA
jgi:glycosyl transferase family 2